MLVKRILALEARFGSRNAPKPPAGGGETGSLELLREGLADLQAEWRRREALPLDEQLVLLRANRAKDLERRRAAPPDELFPDIDALADRIFPFAERDLERRIAKQLSKHT